MARLKSFSKAAEDLFLTQPTVSGHIIAMEKALELRLFDRTGREVQLTKAGKILLPFASRILVTRQELAGALTDFSEGIGGKLSLGASTIPGEYVLPKLIKEFTAERAHLAISLKIADTREIVRDIAEGQVEFGMTGARLNHPSLRYEKYVEDEIVVVRSCRQSVTQRNRGDLENLMKEPWIIREEGSGTQMAVELSLKKRHQSLKQFNVVFEMGSTSSVKESVKAGLGLAFLSKRAVQEDMHQGILCRIDVHGLEPIFRPIYLVCHRSRTLSPVAKRFLRFLRGKREERGEEGHRQASG